MKLENLELIEVTYNETMKKVTLIFLDEENGFVREVNWNRQSFDEDKRVYVDDPEKAKKVDEWAQEYFELPFDELTKALGERRDVYAYDTFNSLWEVQVVKKFAEDMEGQILEVDCAEVVDDGKGIKIRFIYEDELYESKMQYADYNEPRKQWFVNPQKRTRQYEKFEKKFGIPVSQMKELEGKRLMVEVKKAMGKYIYADVKPFPKKKGGK